MSSSGASGGSNLGGAVGQFASQAVMNALPPEVQDLLKPGKTPTRIQQAIAWASKRDPAVLEAHNRHGQKVATFEEIKNVKLDLMDHVARLFARKYRRRAALTGAITGLPGGLWAVAAAGADVQLTAVYAVRMASLIAQSYGYDTTDADEQAHLAEVLALAAGIDSLRGIGNWLTREGLMHVLPDILPRILLKLSVQLSEEQAAKWAGRIVPGLGAAVGGAIDYGFLKAAGDRALRYYHNRYLVDHGMAPPEILGTPTPALAPPSGTVVEGSMVQGPGAGGAIEAPLVQGGVVQGPTMPAGAVGGPAPAARAPLGQQLALPPAKPITPHRSAPERFLIRLAIFAGIVFLLTTALCGGVIFLIIQAVQGIHFG